MTTSFFPAPLDLETGNARPALRAAADAARNRSPAVLAIVVQTEGSTYSRAGTCVLFAGDEQIGWLSGGCLEPELARAACRVAAEGQLCWVKIDTRDDDALFSGNAVGCRGCQWIALLPLHELPGLADCLDVWLQGRDTLRLSLATKGLVEGRCAGSSFCTQLPVLKSDEAIETSAWRLQWHRPPLVQLHGAGPEALTLVPMLEHQGWLIQIVEPRRAWQARLPALQQTNEEQADRQVDAALVMHHNFELDLDALRLLARSRIPFIGLLGPRQRRDDLFKLLDAGTRVALEPRLRSPIGLALGGRGPEAIALSITAQLQAWRHGSALGST
ncbi:XshC-Cox1-family protein [Stenotrophomonas sp. SAU14A_NAIMI4_5]|uniref:XdhC family protein n=1 Tax=Stenotrophomonas sp. SAU14A_NAIMI4_5 TaxID=2072413 RepID=UPI000D5428DD|nr:XdhC/CoxI family protein [Stenotrophomonas sp. SAU14A_NAIMI4_5]AWH49709.1 XshC-Cox1-family protein [Stenotrophomonas sp. SAU14A_NAIMI4_5]